MRRRSGYQEDLVAHHLALQLPRTCSSRLIERGHNSTALAAADLDRFVRRALKDFDLRRGLALPIQAHHLAATTLHRAYHRQDTCLVYCLHCLRKVADLLQVDLQASAVAEIGHPLSVPNHYAMFVATSEAAVRLHHSQEGSFPVHQGCSMALPRAVAYHSTSFDRTLVTSNIA